MNKLDLTPRCKDVLTYSKELAESFNHKYVTTEHIFLSILEKSTAIQDILNEQNIKIDLLRVNIVKSIADDKNRIRKSDDRIGYSPKISRIITLAGIEAKKYSHLTIGTHHLCIAILCDGHDLINGAISDFGVDIPDLVISIILDLDPGIKIAGEPEIETNKASKLVTAGDSDEDERSSRRTSSKKTKYLDTYGINLTEQANKGKLDPLIGRDGEIDEMIQVLLRRRKNNPVIIGDAGVGKTALIEGLAQRISSSDVPTELLNAKIYSIDMGTVISGSKYRGQFEEKLKGIISELSTIPDAIGFVDELHTIVGSGSSEGSLDACNMLKPALSRNQITLIGATTVDEYRTYIESDGALARRFQPIMVDEPDLSEVYNILQGIKDRYEKHHKIKYTQSALKHIITLTDRYITDRYFPDKAIDVMDQLGAKIRSQFIVSDAFDKEIEDKINECENLKHKYTSEKKFTLASKWKNKQKKYTKDYEERFKEFDKKSKKVVRINESHVEDLISQLTDIPVERLDDNTLGRLRTMFKTLQKYVIGQDDALECICNTVKRSRAGISEEGKPLGSFMFLGPTGVGKTHITKVLSEYLFGNEDKVIQLDMSEFMEAHSVSKLIGSPPGYVGFSEGTKLTESIKRQPYSIVLFDEIEKAHPDVHNILLQILEEGKLTDSTGDLINFKNTIIIMTSNVGAESLQSNNTMGFLGEEYHNTTEKVMTDLKKAFRPEFINRIDEVVTFNSLTQDNLYSIIDGLLKDVKRRLRNRNIRLIINDEVKDFLIENGYDEKYGARPLKRAIKKHLETALADFIIDNNLTKRHTIEVNVKDNKISCELFSDLTKKSTCNS